MCDWNVALLTRLAKLVGVAVSSSVQSYIEPRDLKSWNSRVILAQLDFHSLGAPFTSIIKL